VALSNRSDTAPFQESSTRTRFRSETIAVTEMKDANESRGKIIHLLEQALGLADEINDGETGYAIERGLDVARAQIFKPFMPPQ
jgi:hypothetical protein